MRHQSFRSWWGLRRKGVISPLLSNIYLHVLDRVWEDRWAHLGTLVRYADDFVVICDTKASVEAARERVGLVVAQLGLELHPEKPPEAQVVAQERVPPEPIRVHERQVDALADYALDAHP